VKQSPTCRASPTHRDAPAAVLRTDLLASTRTAVDMARPHATAMMVWSCWKMLGDLCTKKAPVLVVSSVGAVAGVALGT
jgi:hypothetical protein